MSDKELVLEDMMAELEECVNNLENSEISLEESFNVFEKGMKLVKACNDKIDRVEKAVLKLNEDGELNEF